MGGKAASNRNSRVTERFAQRLNQRNDGSRNESSSGLRKVVRLGQRPQRAQIQTRQIQLRQFQCGSAAGQEVDLRAANSGMANAPARRSLSGGVRRRDSLIGSRQQGQDILILCADGLTGLKESVSRQPSDRIPALYPMSRLPPVLATRSSLNGQKISARPFQVLADSWHHSLHHKRD